LSARLRDAPTKRKRHVRVARKRGACQRRSVARTGSPGRARPADDEVEQTGLRREMGSASTFRRRSPRACARLRQVLVAAIWVPGKVEGLTLLFPVAASRSVGRR